MTEPPLRFGLETWLAGADPADAGRVAYIANRASVTAAGQPGVEALRDAGVAVSALWAPEHGYAADGAPGANVPDTTAAHGIPVHGVYGTRSAPDAAMLDAVDTMVYDLQDVGARYYTYWYLLKQCLRAAERTGKRLIVCDRPNPLGSARWGNVLGPDHDALVGCWPMAMQHGLTVADVADAWCADQPRAPVTRVRMTGWHRARAWDALGCAWTPPSPNVPDLAAVAAYPGTCLGEGFTLSVGRGTPWPFQWLGAPWLAAETCADAVNALSAGWHAAAAVYTPDQNPYKGERCAGVRLECAQPGADPLPPALVVLRAALQRHPEECRFHASHFDALAGGPELRAGLLAGEPVPTLMDAWATQRAATTLPPANVYPDA